MSTQWGIKATETILEMFHAAAGNEANLLVAWKKEKIEHADAAEKLGYLRFMGGTDYECNDIGPMPMTVRAYAYQLTAEGIAFINKTTH